MPETPVENPSQQPSSKPPANNRRMIFIVIALTVLVLLFLLSASAVDNIRQAIRNQPTPTPIVATPTPTPDETANWKTYTNTKYNYSFKYPDNFKVKDQIPNVLFTFYSPEATFNPDRQFISGISISNRIVSAKDDEIGFDVLYGFKTNNPNSSGTYGKIDNTLVPLKLKSLETNAYRTINTDRTLSITSNIFFNFQGTKTASSFDCTNFDSKDRCQEILPQILSTFKFLDATPSATPRPTASGSGDVACTMEAKQCPDGSYVGRTGPNCEFAKCP